MAKTARSRKRWVNRRPATAPCKLPPGEEDDSDIAPPARDLEEDLVVAPLARNSETIHSVQHSLCQRCRILQKELFHLKYTTLVGLSSLDPDCQYCQQFHGIFELIDMSNKRLTDFTHFTLSREEFMFGNEQTSDHFPYLRIRPGSGFGAPIIHLFPREIRWGSLKYPVGKCIEPSCADFDMFKAVLQHCCANHRSTCTPSPPEASLLRLIDCRDRRIVPASRHQRYICLSYVWGQCIEEVPTFDGTLPGSIPKTVEDAMFVAMQFGIPFLWVDKYCIDQGKPQEKHNIIRNMDRIYHGAELTIIAAVGEDPHHGLPGVRGTPRKPQYQFKLGNEVYAAAELGREEIAESKWGSRGWYISLRERHAERR
jgi:hypothetical protein